MIDGTCKIYEFSNQCHPLYGIEPNNFLQSISTHEVKLSDLELLSPRPIFPGMPQIQYEPDPFFI